MSKTGMFISGSVALQFFNRSLYPSCDLDLYLSVRDVQEVSEWLRGVGYQFDNCPFDTHEDAVYEACSGTPAPNSGFASSKPRGYELADFVLTFYKHAPEQHVMIQLIASARSHIELVLHFHSSELSPYCCTICSSYRGSVRDEHHHSRTGLLPVPACYSGRAPRYELSLPSQPFRRI